MRQDCKARQHGDEYHCGQCGLIWDVKDPDPPECRKPEPKKQEGRRILDALRASLASS